MPAHNGALARLRAYATTVECFGIIDAAACIGTTERRAYDSVRRMIDVGQLFACGTIGHHNRRYTVHKHVADRIDAEAAPKPMTELRWRKKLGACLGGLSDLESLKLRVIVNEDTDCWIWQGAPRMRPAVLSRWRASTARRPA